MPSDERISRSFFVVKIWDVTDGGDCESLAAGNADTTMEVFVEFAKRPKHATMAERDKDFVTVI